MAITNYYRAASRPYRHSDDRSTLANTGRGIEPNGDRVLLSGAAGVIIAGTGRDRPTMGNRSTELSFSASYGEAHQMTPLVVLPLKNGAATNLAIAALLVKMTTTSVHRQISPFGRSIGSIESSLARWATEKRTRASTSTSGSFTKAANWQTGSDHLVTERRPRQSSPRLDASNCR